MTVYGKYTVFFVYAIIIRRVQRNALMDYFNCKDELGRDTTPLNIAMVKEKIPLQLAKEKGHTEIIELICKHEAKE